MINKDWIKRYIPQPALDMFTRTKSRVCLFSSTVREKNRYLKHYGEVGRDNQVQLGAKIMLYTHEIQKGLSHEDFRFGFGRQAIHNLATSIKKWLKQDFPLEDANFAAGLKTLRAYERKHIVNGVALPEFFESETHTIKELMSSLPGDQTEIVRLYASSKVNNSEKKFSELFLNRFSTREFSDELVDVQRVKDAVELAMKSPSMCNRQPSRVVVITDKKRISRILSIQGGMKGYELPPMLVAITADLEAYLFDSDSNSNYIDGGLFSMSFLLALENEGLAACPLSTSVRVRREKALRKELILPKYENLIMLIAVGNFRDSSLSPLSDRYTGEQVMRVITK